MAGQVIMRLYPKMILIIGCMFIAILIILLISFQYNIMNSFSSLEEQQIERELFRAEHMIREDISSLEQIAIDWAEWDLMYDFSLSRDPNFFPDNFASSTFSAQNLQYLIILDSKGDTILAKGIDSNRTLHDVPPEFIQMLPITNQTLTQKQAGLIRWHNTPYMFAQNPVLPMDHNDPPRGSLILMSPIDQECVTAISDNLLQNVTIRMLTPDENLQIFSGSKTRISQNTIQADTILKDVYDEPFLLLRVEEVRDLYESGILTRDYLFFSLLLLAVSFMGVAITLINLIVIAPLGELNKELAKVGETGLLSVRIKTDRNDEIGDLGRSINQMLDHIEKAVEERHATEQRLSRLIALAEEGICLVNPDHQIWFANPKMASMFGMTPYEMNGREIMTLLMGDKTDSKEVDELFLNQPVHREYHTRKKDGTELYVDVLAAPYPLEKEEDGHLCVISDITTFKDNEKALLLSNKKLGLLGSMTRHDIVNQLTTIRGMLGLVHRKTDDEVVLNLVESAEEAAERINKHIEFTKEYQKAGLQAPVWQNLQTCWSLAYAMTKKKGLTFSYQGGAYEVYADQLLQKVFYNLIDNSLKHGKNVFYITIRTDIREKKLVVIYEDDGEGIQDTMKERVFERGVGSGTGWGLFFAREVLSLTDITISEQGTFGIGARFELIIPDGGYRPVQSNPDDEKGL
ncbi:CHASE4 domain-containing protein [Methanospirillum stamsii]|uniref:histidine kinase n=1 Tax=Methanospirillum stamsii TaxID=1277351 RepID=A0A2V2N335_9EURY|nr:CHASE4 domain-containing protein [Methanospirillum stamsii]PWR72925.1 hypothetical protein DLD82_11700 [Methanospirillum stamsii]